MRGFVQYVALAMLIGFCATSAAASADCNWRFPYILSADEADAVIAACSKLLAQTTEHSIRSKILDHRGEAQYTKGRLAEAIADFNAAIAEDPNDDRAFFSRSSFYRYKQPSLERAVADLSTAIKLAPNNNVYLTSRADIYAELGKFDEAIADYDKAIASEPNRSTLLVDRGKVWRMRGDYRKADADYEAALKLNPADSRASEGRATSHAVLGLGPTLDGIRQPSQSSATPRYEMVSSRKMGSVTVEVWNRDGKLHHCSTNSAYDDPASAVARTDSKYVLTLASGKWALGGESAYSVIVIAEGAQAPATGAAMDAMTIGIPLVPTKEFFDAWHNTYKLSVKAASKTIRTDGGSLELEAIDACWRDASRTARTDPFASGAPPATPKTDPFAPVGGSSHP